MLQIPNEQHSRDFSSFNSWVKQHLADSDEAGADFSLNSQADFLSYLHSILQAAPVANASAAEADDIYNDVLPAGSDNALPLNSNSNSSSNKQQIAYLYMAWAQHHNASDMAGTFGQDRIQLQLLHKHNGYWVSHYGVHSANRISDQPLALLTESTTLESNTQRSSLPFISGIAINAP
ncbi:MAG: hypothetical protein LAT84_09520 [Balneolia bacterium]|nr:hypothetical protein [Balneolia bacterium]